MVISYAFGWLKSMRWCRTWRHGEKQEKVFVKNSSLVTLEFNPLTIKTLQCDELHFQLVTLLITTSRNVKNFGQKRAKMAGCDELRNQLVTPYQADIQRVKPHCDEWWVFNKTFLVLESTNISKRITRSWLPTGISKKHIYRNQGKASTAMDLYALHTEKHEKGNMNGYAL